MSPYINFFTTSDNVGIRYGLWPCRTQKTGTVVLLTGRSEFLEKYKEIVNRLNQRHLDVISLDWRGQGLSSRLLPNPHKGYVATFDDYLNDLKEIYIKVLKPQIDRVPLMFMGHSMGGHLALRFAHDCPEEVDRLILTAPMLGINFKPLPGFLVRWLTFIMTVSGNADKYAPGCKDYRIDDQKFQGNKLTSDPERFLDHINAVKENPDLALGGVTYGWLRAAFESIDLVRSPGYTEAIKIPLMMAVAGNDRVVPLCAQEEICSKIICCRLLVVENARHEILKETDEIQSQFWKSFDAFVS